MRRLCRHGKAESGRSASIQIHLNSLLTANQEGSRSSHDLRRNGLQIVSLMSRSWEAVAEFGVQAGEPGLDHSGIFSFGEHPDQLEGKPQTLFGITYSSLPFIHRSTAQHVPDTPDVGGELAADEATSC